MNCLTYHSLHSYRHSRFREKVKLVLKATRQHAYNLATFAIIYKASMIVMKHLNPSGPKEGPYDTFFAGLLGGYVVFGRHPGSVSQQVRLASIEVLNKGSNYV